MKRRRFIRDIVTHCYQRSADGGLLFYSHSDHLVHFTRYCIVARKYGIRVLSLCQMPDHIHDTIIAQRPEQLEKFKRETNSGFSRDWNEWGHLTGSVMESPFGSAPKIGDKKARTNLIYVGNNPVERKLTQKAEDFRWNFLAYADSKNPFSEKLVIREARWPMQKAVKEIKSQFKANKPVTYAMLKRLSAPLTMEERMQLTDFIISTYNVIDYGYAIRFFGSFAKMISAMHVTTGSEYELNEVSVGRSDAHYSTMSSYIIKKYRLKDIHEMLSFSPKKKYEVFLDLLRISDALPEQIAKFPHTPLIKASNGNL